MANIYIKTGKAWREVLTVYSKDRGEWREVPHDEALALLTSIMRLRLAGLWCVIAVSAILFCWGVAA